jgi:hypothetical protein
MRATLQAVMPYELHGTRYYQLIIMPEGGPRPMQARLSHEMILGDPQIGDTVEVHAILGIVDRVTRVESDAETA